MAESLQRTEYYYNTDNVLQNVVVWEFPKNEESTQSLPPQSSSVAKKYWLIFIHGGAWRDPRETFSEAEPTINALLAPGPGPDQQRGEQRAAQPQHLPPPSSRIAGFASINYRLSPHPGFAQDPATTPAFAARAARHPDHLADVVSALRFLQGRLGFGADDYVLFGHSAGASLGYQALLMSQGLATGAGGEEGGKKGQEQGPVALPAAVVGFEGIYDLVGLDERMGGTYASFIEGAFGTDRRAWAEASPATARGSYAGWSGAGAGPGRLAVLAHSPDDELVDMAELDAMEARLRRDGVPNVLVFRDLRGGHAEVLNDGSFARVLGRTLEELERLGRA